MVNVGQIILVIKQANRELENQLIILDRYERRLEDILQKTKQTFSGSVLETDIELQKNIVATLDEIKVTKQKITKARKALDQVAIM